MATRTGVWLVGALGGLATTVVAGARLIGRGLVPPLGLATAGPEFRRLDLVPVGDLEFGGHDVRAGSLVQSAEEIARDNGSIPREHLDVLRPDLERAGAWIRPGTAVNAGRAIDQMTEPGRTVDAGKDLRGLVARIQADVEAFRQDRALDRVIVVNVASTEPPLAQGEAHDHLAGIEGLLDGNVLDSVRASLLYAYAAIAAGHPYVNFTPSNAALVPGIAELAAQRGVPFMGSDGKTGETLVKTALAPMFRYRALRVLTWQGYNILGDRDGQVLADEEHLASKVKSKDRALAQILGYPLHTHVGIDYVPSLKDLKTAWDFIHFEGFLGHRMSMQFIWQGCDAVLAAPVVLDLVRLVDHAARTGVSGPLPHLACFFKSPHDVAEHDLHRQWWKLIEWADRA